MPDEPSASSDTAAATETTTPAERERAAAAAPADRASFKRFRGRWMALLAGTAIALYLCWQMIEPFITVLLWAAVLVIVFYPVHLWIVRKTGRPGWAALLSCLLVCVAILAPLTLVTFAVVNEAQYLADYVRKNKDELSDPDKWPGPLKLAKPYVDRAALREQFEATAESIGGAKPVGSNPPPGQDPAATVDAPPRQSLLNSSTARAIGGAAMSRAFQVVGGLLGVVLKIFFVLFTMYYLFRDGERVKQALHDLMPLDYAQAHEIFERTREVISASVHGVVVIAAAQGLIGGITFALLGLRAPLLWGTVMFLLSMIPMAGAFLVWGPAVLYLFLTKQWIKGFILFVVGAGVIGMVDNVLRPRLVGQRTRLHELLIFFSVLGGLQVFGVLGLVVGPVVVAIALALIDVFRQSERPAAVTLREPTLIEEQANLREVREVRKEGKGQPAPAVTAAAPVDAAAGMTAPVTVPAGGGGRKKKRRRR